MFLRRIGYWSGGPGGETGLPDPHDFVDPDWDADEREDVIDHLTSHPPTWWYMGYSPCRMCDKKDNGSGEFTDGTFVWPQGLAHYVVDHHVRLPEWFVTHVRASGVEREQAVVDDEWWREAAYRRAPEVAPSQTFRLERIDCGTGSSSHLVYAADDGQRVVVGWQVGQPPSAGQATVGNAASNSLGFHRPVPTGPDDRLLVDADELRRHVNVTLSAARATPVRTLSPAVIHTDRVAAAALQRAAAKAGVSLDQQASRLDRETLQRNLAEIEARGPFDPVRQRELVQLLLAVAEHLGADTAGHWERLVAHERDSGP